jgi:hypothetical protein
MAGCGGPSVEAALAAVPRIPAPHVPPRLPGHIARWEPYEPSRVRPRVVPPDGAAGVEALREQRVRQLERRYAQMSALGPRLLGTLCKITCSRPLVSAVSS